jgi:hypothetical protein
MSGLPKPRKLFAPIRATDEIGDINAGNKKTA